MDPMYALILGLIAVVIFAGIVKTYARSESERPVQPEDEPETALSPALAEIVGQAEMLLQDLYSEEMSE